MSAPTPIEIVREYQRWRRAQGQYAGLCQCPHTPEEIGLALDSVLSDAERFKALERAHDGRSVYAMCIESHDQKARFTGYDLAECPLAELADRLREGGR